MKTAIVTGSLGLIGSESVKFLVKKGYNVIGIDNDMRKYFFGDNASTAWNKEVLEKECGDKYSHYNFDIRNESMINHVFAVAGDSIEVVIHTAAQPSHDWAAKEPKTDFGINAVGTLNMLEAVRQYCPKAVFIFTSTNKVYGDAPNRLQLTELEKRYELTTEATIDGKSFFKIDFYGPFSTRGISERGISEEFSIDNCLHSVFGASKVAADIMVQEYGKYFGMKTGIFRCGCLTGPAHSGTELHGFLSYLMKCTMTKTPYRIFGYKGKQVRSNIHSHDLLNAFYEFILNPKQGEVYNMDGGRQVNCSMLEAIETCEKITGNKLEYTYIDEARIGDHQWYITDNSKFKRDFPNWKLEYDIEKILQEIYQFNIERWKV